MSGNLSYDRDTTPLAPSMRCWRRTHRTQEFTFEVSRLLCHDVFVQGNMARPLTHRAVWIPSQATAVLRVVWGSEHHP